MAVKFVIFTYPSPQILIKTVGKTRSNPNLFSNHSNKTKLLKRSNLEIIILTQGLKEILFIDMNKSNIILHR